MKACAFPFLSADLPEGVEVGGVYYPADFSVSAVLRLLGKQEKLDPESTPSDLLKAIIQTVAIIFHLHGGECDLERDSRLAAYAQRIIRGFPMRGADKPKVKLAPTPENWDALEEQEMAERADMDFVQDAPAMISSFRQIYGLDLAAIRSMHWWEFLALLQWLPADGNALGSIRRVRSMKIPANASPETKREINKAKRALRLQEE